MTRDRRILLLSEFEFTAGALSFLTRSSIQLTFAKVIKDASDAFELVVLDDRTMTGSLEANLDELSGRVEKILVLARETPPPPLIEKADGFLIEPYTQSELIGAIGELLGVELRRALRLGVAISGQMQAGLRREPVTILQLSETGCLLELESSITVGDEVEVSFVLPSNREELSLRGRVVSGNELQLLYGLRFATDHEKERLAILVFVELGLAAGMSEAPQTEGR